MNKVEHFRMSASPFRATYGNFIGGKFMPAKSGRTFDTSSPSPAK
jgi:aldehyde dehydrogenase